MDFNTSLAIAIILLCGVSVTSLAYAQIDPYTDIKFLQTGIFSTSEKQFHVSNDITIREFHNGSIIRISGQTTDGFPYFTYSKIINNEISTYGKIFINGQFINLALHEKQEQKIDNQKKEDITILTQHTQRVYSNNFAKIDIKIFDQQQNKLNDFYQNYGHVPDTNIQIVVNDEDNQKIYSISGITNNKGLFETEFFIPENSKKETLAVTINAENENSKSSKTLQMFTLGKVPSTGQ